MRVNAATMLNQSKTAFQAEIDSACELIDFWRFNCHYARGFMMTSNRLYLRKEFRIQPRFDLWKDLSSRLLHSTLPVSQQIYQALQQSLVVRVLWKPSRNSYHSNYVLMQLMMEARLPPGVINFLPGSGAEITEVALANPDFAGLHFTGSTAVFQGLWQEIGLALSNLRSYPRIVREN